MLDTVLSCFSGNDIGSVAAAHAFSFSANVCIQVGWHSCITEASLRLTPKCQCRKFLHADQMRVVASDNWLEQIRGALPWIYCSGTIGLCDACIP